MADDPRPLSVDHHATCSDLSCEVSASRRRDATFGSQLRHVEYVDHVWSMFQFCCDGFSGLYGFAIEVSDLCAVLTFLLLFFFCFLDRYQPFATEDASVAGFLETRGDLHRWCHKGRRSLDSDPNLIHDPRWYHSPYWSNLDTSKLDGFRMAKFRDFQYVSIT